MGKVMRRTLGASLNIRHNLSSSKGPKPLQLKLLTTYIPKTSAFTLAFSTSDRKSGSAGMPRPISYAVFCLKKKMTVAGQNSNNSLRLTNDFLARVENGAAWHLTCRTDGKFPLT